MNHSQAREVTQNCAIVGNLIKTGLDCDEIENGQGALVTLYVPSDPNSNKREYHQKITFRWYACAL